MPVAELERAPGERGWLIRLSNGVLAHFTRQHSVRSLDQRKAEAALAKLVAPAG